MDTRYAKFAWVLAVVIGIAVGAVVLLTGQARPEWRVDAAPSADTVVDHDSPAAVVETGRAAAPDVASAASSAAAARQGASAHASSERYAADAGVRARADRLQNLVMQYLSEQPGLELTSLDHPRCDAKTCEIVFTATEPNPQFVDRHSELFHDLMRQSQHWEDFTFGQGGISLRERAPGAKEFVMTLGYQAYVALSEDPRMAARQHAECAGRWASLIDRYEASLEEGGQRSFVITDEGTAGAVREFVARELTAAADVLGRAEAQRLADEFEGGALIHDCVLASRSQTP